MKKAFCPICNSVQGCTKQITKVVYSKLKFVIIFCDKCKMVMRYPVLNNDEINQYYSSGYNLTQYHNNLEKTFQVMMLIGEYRLNFISDVYGSIPSNYFEVGVGAGSLIYLFKEKGANVIGLDPDRIAAKWLIEKKGIKIHNMLFEDFTVSKEFALLKKKCDIISLCHVLEHVPKPVEFLKNIRKLINPKTGMLYIEVPNVYKPYSCGTRWRDYYCDPGHLYYYSSLTLKFILRESGFEIIKITTDGFAPFYPISCMVQADNDIARLNKPISDNSKKIRKIWFWFKLKHNMFYFPKRYFAEKVKKLLFIIFKIKWK